MTTLIACGGTIESRTADDGTKEIVGGIERLAPDARIVRFRTVPSFTLDLGDLLALVRTVHAVADDAPAIVTCGTDTLEDVGFVLDCLAPPAGVVITGAAVGGVGSADAEANLHGARLAAADPVLPEHVAVVAFAGRYRAGRAVEETAPPPDLYGGSPVPAIGWWGSERAEWVRAVTPLRMPVPAGTPPVVSMVSAHPAVTVPEAAVDEPDVLVVMGYGAGNVPPGLAVLLERRLAAGRTVVLVSRTPALPVRPISWDLGGSARLLDRGAWSAGPLPARKAALLAALVAPDRERFADLVDVLGGDYAGAFGSAGGQMVRS